MIKLMPGLAAAGLVLSLMSTSAFAAPAGSASDNARRPAQIVRVCLDHVGVDVGDHDVEGRDVGERLEPGGFVLAESLLVPERCEVALRNRLRHLYRDGAAELPSASGFDSRSRFDGGFPPAALRPARSASASGEV